MSALASPQMPAKKAPPARTKSTQINVRVSELARQLLDRIGAKHGMNLTHTLEYAIRQCARAEGVWDIEPSSKKS